MKKQTEQDKQTEELFLAAYLVTECFQQKDYIKNPEGMIHQLYAILQGWDLIKVTTK